MDEYLTYTKRRLSELETVDKVHVVLGNEACDLDSAVAALTYAFYLHHKSIKDAGVLYLPVLNITSDQYRLRTETVYFLGKLNIKQTDLTFRDDIDLQTLKVTGKLNLTLVDHNVLVVHDQSLEDLVTTVIDHRPRDRQEQAGVRVVIELVGSCCTLIAEELLSDPDFNLNHQVALLLYGTILTDTVNRSVAAGKLTQRDEAVLQRLEGVLQDVNGQQLYEDIQIAKCDLSGLTTMEILEKDMKMVPGTSMTVAMSSVSVDMQVAQLKPQELLSRECLTSDLETFCQQKGCPVVVIMSITAVDEDNIYRQLAVFSTNRIFREQICDVLDLSINPNLQLEPVKTSLENMSIFRQGNVKASRKKVLPVIKAFLNGDKTPDITSKEFASETQQAAAKVTEGFSSFSNLLDTSTTSMQNQSEESFFTGSDETHKQLFSKDDFNPFGAMNSDDIPVKESQSRNLVDDGFDPFATSSMQNQSEEDSYFTVSNETQFSDAEFDPFGAVNNDDIPIKEECDKNLVDMQRFDPFKTVSNSESNEWQSGSEICSLDPWNSNGTSESVLKQTGSDLQFFDTFIHPVQSQSGSEAEHHAASDSTSVQSKVQMDDFELMNPESLNEEPGTQSVKSSDVDLGHLNQDNSASDQNLSANTNQPLLDFEPFFEGESSGEDLKNSCPVFTSQAVSFADSAQLSPLQNVNVSDPFKDKSSDNLKFDQYSRGSFAAQDGRDKFESVFDSLELNEADFFDQINTPDYQSGLSTPLINSGISTPFDSLHVNHSGRNSESESGYPTITQTPPHSFTESGMANLDKDHVLPSFNSSEMVERIHKKKASLHGAIEINFNTNSVPYTPQNSFIEGTFDAAMIDRDLPSFDNSEFLQKIQEKRSSLAGIHEGDVDSEVSQYPYAPHNSLINATFDKYAQENLSSLNDADAVEIVREKQAALAFLTGSDMSNLSTQNENPSLGSVESNNPFLVNIESEASSSINPFLFMDDSLSTVENFMSPFTPQNNFSESNLPLMENRDSSVKTEHTETHSRKLPLIMDNENFQNVAAQNPTFENLEKENLDSMQNETDEIEKDVCETGSLDNNFKEQECQEEHEQREISLKEEENNDLRLFKTDLFYIERGKEEVLYSGFKSVANASILDKDDVRLSEISNSWGQDIQQRDIVNNDNLDSGNIQSPSRKSKPDGLDGEYQIIESSIAQTEVSSDSEEELENGRDTRSEEDLLGSRDMEEIQEIAYSVAGEIIQTVLDNFPDLHIPNVVKTLHVVESISLEKGSEVPITEVPNKSEGEIIFSLETEYLPNMDPLGGNMDLVTSPSFSAQDQDNEFGDVETVSFHRASHEECHGDSLHEGDTAHSVTLLSAQVLENETPVFVPDKLGSDLVSNQQVVSGDMTSLSHATAVDLESNEKVNDNQLDVNIGQAQALEPEKQNSDSHEPDLDVVLPEASNVSFLIDGPSFVPETNIEVAQLLESERQNLVTQQLDMESVSHQPDSDWISFNPSSDFLLCKPVSEVVLSLTDDAGDGFASSRMIPVDHSVGTELKNVPQDDYEAGEQYSFPDGPVLESFKNDLIANENEVSVEIEKFPSEMESVMNEKMLDLAGNIVNSVLASAIECTMGERMKTNVKTHIVSEESIDFSPVSTSLEDDVIEFASETEIDHVETVLETEISQIGRSGERKIFHIESTFETDIPDIEIQCEKEMSQNIQATREDRVQADGEGRHDSSDSEDSDTSSTTTEGSYRIEDPGVTYPPEMLYDTMDTIENSDLGQETPANCLLAEEVMEKVNIPDFAVSKRYTYTSKMDESKQLDYVLKDISGASDSVPDTEDKYAGTEIVENRDLLENQVYSSLIDLEAIPSIPHTEISSADSQTGTDVKEIWELQDQNGHIVEPFLRQTAEKDEKVQTWEGYEESLADTQNNNNSALVVDVKQDENESLSAYHTAETSKEEETVPDLMTLVVHKKGKLKGGYSLDLPIPFVIIQEAADDLPSEEESPSPPSASTTGKKSSDTADNSMQNNKRNATETDKDECESLGDIALTDSVSHESELTGRKQAEDDAFLSKADSTTGLKSHSAENTHIKIIFEEVLENAKEEEYRLQEGNVGKESVCLKMSASEIDAGSFDENRLGKDTEIQEKSFATDSTSEVFEQLYATEEDTISAVGENLDEDEIVADFRTAKDLDAFKSQSAEIAAYSTDTDFESSSAFTDFKPAVEFDAFKMQPSYNATKNYSEHFEKSYAAAAETMSSEENTVVEDSTVADLQPAEEFDVFKSQSTEITVDSTCTDFENSFAFADFKLGDKLDASKMQSSYNGVEITSEHFEKSYAAEEETMPCEESKVDEDNIVADVKTAEESDAFKSQSAETAAYSTGTDFEKSFPFTYSKSAEEFDVSKMQSSYTAAENTNEHFEKSNAAGETMPAEADKMCEDNAVADFKSAEDFVAFKSQSAEIAAYSTGTDFENSFAFTEFKSGEEYDSFRMNPSYNVSEGASEHFEKSCAAEAETMSSKVNTVDEGSTVADLKPSEEFDVFKSQSTENTVDSTCRDFEKSFAFADFKLEDELFAFKMQSSCNAVEGTSEHFEKSYAAETETIFVEENKVDEHNTVAAFKPTEDLDAFKSQSAEIAAYSTYTDFENSSAFAEYNSGEEFDASKMQPSYNAAESSNEQFEKSYAAEAETMSSKECTIDEGITVADLQPAEELDVFKSQSTEITVDSTCRDFEKSFAFADFKPGDELDASKMQSSCNAVESTSEHFEKSYAAETETMPDEENKVDEHNTVAAFKPTEDLDALKRQLTEITVDSTSKDSEKSSVANVVTQSTPENKMGEDDTVQNFKPAEEFDAFKSQTTETTAYSTGTDFENSFAFADFKPAEELDASKMQSSYNAANNTDEHFEKSYAAEEETMPCEENKMDEVNTVADFKSAEDFDASKSQSAEIATYSTYTDFENSFAEYKPGEDLDAFKVQPSYNAAESSNEQFEKSYAAEAETMSSKECTIDEGITVADLQPAEELDVFKSQSTEITIDSTCRDFEKSFAFADFKPGDELDASKMQSSCNAVESTSEHFEKSYAAETETMPDEENKVDEHNTVAAFKPTEDLDALKRQLTEITVDSTSKDSEKSSVANVVTQSTPENKMGEDDTVQNFKPAEEFDAFKSQTTETTAYSTGTDFENSFAFADFKPAEELDASKMQSSYNAANNTDEHFEKSYAAEEETMPCEENKMDEVNTVADFKSAEDFDASKSQSAEIATYSTYTDFENSFAEYKPGEDLDAFKVQPSYNAAESSNEQFEKSYAAEAETMSSKECTIDEGITVADLQPAEELDVFKSQSTEITIDSTCRDFEKSFAFADFKPGDELDASKMQSSCNAVESTSEHFEKSYAAETETMPDEENKVDEHNTVAAFKPTEDLDALKRQLTEITVDSTSKDSEKSSVANVVTQSTPENKMDEDDTVQNFKPAEEFDAFKRQTTETTAYSTGTDFENSFAFADFKPAEELDASKMQSSYNAANNTDEHFEKSYAAEEEIMPCEENKMDEDNTVADFKSAEDFDAFKSQSAEIAAYSTYTDFENSFAFAEYKSGEEFDASKMQPSYNAAESSNEQFEKSYAAEAETMSSKEYTVDKGITVADLQQAEELDVFKSQSTEITVDSTCTDFEKSFAFADFKLGEELEASKLQSSCNAVESTSEHFEKSYAAEAETIFVEENKVDEYNTVAAFKPTEDRDAFKSQSTEIRVDSTGTDFENSFAFADFKPAEELYASKMQSSYNTAKNTDEHFEKSYAAEEETMPCEENKMDEVNTVADFKSAEDFDAFKSQSAEIAAYSTYTDFENSFAFAEYKSGEEFDASKMQPFYNAAESSNEQFEKSYAAEAETMSSTECTIDEGITVADLQPAEELDVFKSQSIEITVDSTGADFEHSFAFADFKPAEELDASKMQLSYNAANNTDEHFEKSYAAEEETMPCEENKMDEDNTVADFKSAEDFDAFKSQSAEIAAYSTYTDFENSFAFAEYKSGEEFDASKMQPSYNAAESSNEQFEKSYAAEAETMSSKECTIDKGITVADLKPASDNLTESSSENFETSYADEVETLFAEKNKMEEDNTVADFKPAEEFDVFKNQITDITADNMGRDFENSSVAEVESKSREETKVNDGTSTDFEKFAAETENKSLLEEKVIEDNTSIDLKPAQECDSSKSKSTEDKAENTSRDHKSLERLPVSDIDNRSSVLLRKEVYMTTAGRMSINIDSTYENMVPEQKEDSEKMTSSMQYPGVSTVLEELQVEQIIQEADSLVADVDKTLASSDQSCGSSSIHSHELMAASLQPTEPKDKSLKEVENEKRHKRKTSVTSLGSKEKMRGMDWTEEFYEDPIPGMEAEEVCDSSDDSQVGSSDSEEDDSKPGRPNLLFDEGKGKKRIAADANILNKDESADDLLDDPPTPDDLGDGSGELEWEKRTKLQESQAKTDDTPVTSPSEPLSSQYCARDDDDDEDKADNDKNQFRKVEIAGKEHRVDMGVIEPYKKVLSHGGYYGDGLNAIILFSGCYLPDRSRRDYQYVMDNLFLYVISTLELLVAEDYMIVYFHGATPRRQMPSFGWLKKCYQTIDRRLKKNLKTLLLVHPTLWLKTVVMMTKPFISSKFSSKLRFVKTLRELATIIPMEYIYVPEPVQLYDDRLRNSTSISTPSSSTSDTTTPR